MGLFDDIVAPTEGSSGTAPSGGGLFDDIVSPGAKSPDTTPTFWGTVKQLPLGIARGVGDMLTAGAPAGMSEAIAANPQLYDTLLEQQRQQRETGQETGDNLIPTPQDYHKQMHGALTRFGIEGENSPKNMPERIASGAGKALPWGAAAGAPGLLGNLAVAGVGGAGGALAEEFVDEKDKPLANVAGNLIGSFGMAGAMRLAEGIMNLARSYRMLPGEAAEFKIPATKGMIGDRTTMPEGVTPQMQLSQEEGMQRGAQGYLAQKIMERNRQAREGAVAKAGEDIEIGMGGPRTTPVEAGETVGQGLKTEAEALRSAGNEAYETAAKKTAWAETHVRPSAVVENELEKANVFLDEFGNYPMSHTAMKIIGKLDRGSGPQPAMSETGLIPSKAAPRPGETPALPISVQDINQARKSLNALKASRPEDARGLSHIRKAFDAWEKDLVENALFIGDKSVMDDLTKGRELWHRYRTMTDKDPKRDYSKVISDIVNNDRTPEQVANWLLNVNSHDTAGRASRLARYIKKTFGTDSAEWESLRQAFVHKAMNPEGVQQGPAAIARAIESAVNGKGAPLARALLDGPGEIDRLQRYARALRQISPKLENPPNSGWVNTRYLWGLINAGSGAAGLAGTYHTGDKRWLALGVVPFVKNYRSAMKAIDATTQTTRGPSMFQRGTIGSLPAAPEYERRQ